MSGRAYGPPAPLPSPLVGEGGRSERSEDRSGERSVPFAKIDPSPGSFPSPPSPPRGEGKCARGKDRELLLSSTSVGRNPASVLPPPVGAISSTERPARARASSSS